ncbi:MAG: hypothetical protein H0X47_09015 [Nitrospirales bacterium]|nr:hypothetical protein [Nitrospirales bacterium]
MSRTRQILPNGQPRRCLDVTWGKQLFGFEAKHSPTEGLRKTVQWFRTNQHALREVQF